MAITACFAGPLCNILNGLGVGFLLLLESGGRSGSSKPVSFVDVQLSTPVLTDTIIVCGNCALVLVLGLLNSNRLPARAGLLLTCMYGLYLAINLVVHYM
jgi:Ca2+/Na+ antiporter